MNKDKGKPPAVVTTGVSLPLSILLKKTTYMKTRNKLIGFVLLLATASLGPVRAQQNVDAAQATVVSPQVNPDHTVTFRLDASAARKVEVVGDWQPRVRHALTRGNDGIWQYTTPVLQPEMYTYRFLLDDVYMLDPANPFTCRDVANVFSLFFIDGPYADEYQVHDVPHGNLTVTWYHSNRLGEERRMSVYTPPYYEQDDRPYPVLYLLHGGGGDENAWVELGKVVRIMDNLIAKKAVEPMIVVMPNGNSGKAAAAGETCENLADKPMLPKGLPWHKDGRFEEAFPEIVDHIDATFRTVPDKEHRAIAGLSMGGFQTLFIAANYPEYFNHIGLFSANVDFTGLRTELDVYSDLTGKLQRLGKEGYKTLWIGIGTEDQFFRPTCRFRRQLQELNLPFEYTETDKGHQWANWRKYLILFAPKLFHS